MEFYQRFLGKDINVCLLSKVIEKNKEKAKEKQEKRMGLMENQIYNNAKMSTKANVNLANDMNSP